MQLKEKMRSEFAKERSVARAVTLLQDASGDFWVSQLPAHAKDMLKCPQESSVHLRNGTQIILQCCIAFVLHLYLYWLCFMYPDCTEYGKRS